jgi:outer membrane protein assembly factor BamB
VVTGLSADQQGFAFVGGVGRTVKYDGRTGAVLWNVTFADPGGKNLYLVGVAVGADGDPVVVGFFQDDSCAPGIICRPFAVKYDGSSGAVRWTTELSGFPSWAAVAVDDDRHLAWTLSDCDPDLLKCDIKTARLDGSTGALVWSTTFSSGGSEIPSGNAVTPEGHPVASALRAGLTGPFRVSRASSSMTATRVPLSGTWRSEPARDDPKGWDG